MEVSVVEQDKDFKAYRAAKTCDDEVKQGEPFLFFG
jgi:hypothetical protein